MNDETLEKFANCITIDLSNLESLELPTINETINIDLNIDWFDNWKLEQEWVEINNAAKGNEALQKAIERVKILYYLSKEDGNSKT